MKQFYARTNHRAFERQIARHERRVARLQQIKKQLAAGQDSTTATHADNDDETLPQLNFSEHYHISHSRKDHFNLTRWLADNKDDKAVEVFHFVLRQCTAHTYCTVFQNFLPMLKDHLLRHISGTPSEDFSNHDRRQLVIHKNQVFRHKTLQINFTTYDCRRDQDTINIGTHSDIMVLANPDEDPENSHPYWYARVIGIFHATVQQVGSSTSYENMDFLWVRWYGFDVQARSGFKACRLHQVGFLDSNDPGAFGFLDPHDLLRAVHLVPAFEFGKSSRLLSQSIARHKNEGHEDYQRYYINMCVFYICHWLY